MMETSSSMARPVTIGICTSSSRSNIEAFITKVSSLTNVTVRFIELPYSDLDSFRLSSAGLDGVIICHSIDNRRFAITDVMDALYNKFLPNVRRHIGKANVCVIAHDFSWHMGTARSGSLPKDHARIKDTYMDSFRSKQPTTFECCKLAMICGRLDKQVDMDEEDWKQLEYFFLQCRVKPEWTRYIIYSTLDTIDGLITIYITPRIPQAIRSVFAPVEDDSLVPVAQRSQEAQRILRYILQFVCFPVTIWLMTVDCILSRMKLNCASCSLCILFKKDVINKTLKRSEDCKGLCGNWFWICFIPFHLTCNSCWFAFSLVEGCCSCVCQYPGFINSRYFGSLNGLSSTGRPGPRKIDLIRA